MGRAITEEQKIEINERYLACGVKSQVAKAMGISAASVSKYIIEGYVPKANKDIVKFCGEIKGAEQLISQLEGTNDIINFLQNLRTIRPEEKEKLIELQEKEILV